MSKPSIAIIGLEGSGKTVLMTVLAKRLSQSIQNGFFLDPIGSHTIKYIDNTWETLQGGDWPPSTAPGEMFNLKWNMHVSPGYAYNSEPCEAEVHLVDAAGQDIRQLFSNDIPLNEVPAYLQPLAQYFSQASILLFLINIKDYVGESDIARKTENQAAIKAALDVLQQGHRRIAFVFTQMDQYRAYIENHGGLTVFIQKFLPYVYNAYIANKDNTILNVAAVNDTEIKETSDGLSILVPKRNFSSFGLEDVGTWLAKQVVELCLEEQAAISAEQERQRKLEAERVRKRQEEERARIAAEQEWQRQQEAERQRQKEKNKRNLLKTQERVQDNSKKSSGCGCIFLILVLIAAAVFLAIQNEQGYSGKGGIGGGGFVYNPDPVIEKTERFNNCVPGILWGCKSHHAYIGVTVYNPGRAGTFVLKAVMTINGGRYTGEKTIYLEKGERQVFYVEFNNLNYCPQKYSWSATATVNKN